MSKIQIGYEIEFGSKYDRKTIAKGLKDDLDLKLFSWNPLPYKCWSLVNDTSLKFSENINPHELVSPVLPLEEGISILQDIFTWMKDNRCVTNHTCGFHVNLSFNEKRLTKQMDLLKLILLLDEETILRQFQRLRNSFCQGHQGVLRYYAYDGDYVNERDLRSGLIYEKEMFVNLLKLESNYLEFRGMGNRNYHKRYSEIILNIYHFVDCMEKAILHDAESTKQFKKLINDILSGE